MPTLPTLRRAVRAATPALAVGTAALTAILAACADSPTGPATPAAGAADHGATAAAAAAFSKGTTAGAAPSTTTPTDAPEDPAKRASKAAKDSVKDAKKAVADAAHRIDDAHLDALAATWHTPAADQEGGQDTASALRCHDTSRRTASTVIGARGGELKIGGSRLIVPAGALHTPVTITGIAIHGAGGPELVFEPHGLQFQKAVQIVADYHGCDAPVGTARNLYYVAPGHTILQVLPTADHGASHEIRALTDHFSGYLVSWGRK